MSRSALQINQPLEYPSRRKKFTAKQAAKRAGKLHLVAYAPSDKRRPSAEVAVEHIRILIQSMIDGRRRDGRKFTYAEIYREIGLNEQFGCDLMRGRITRVGTKIIDRICMKTEMTVADLMDEISDD